MIYSITRNSQTIVVFTMAIVAMLFMTNCRQLLADGKVIPPRNYTGSLEEKSQEAIIIFDESESEGEPNEHLILKIRVAGDAKQFAWVIPFPNVPEIEKEEAALFRDIFNYVEYRNSDRKKGEGAAKSANDSKGNDGQNAVEVIERKIVGNFDVAIVKENEEGGLPAWLEAESFQPLENAEDVLGFYRKKNYVFACIKVDSALLAENDSIDSHPLRFSFATGGTDGIYFPMKMTGLQETPFDVNLYVFYRFWLNDKINQFGYTFQDFHLHYRDWDTRSCVANGGKLYSDPTSDPFLKAHQRRLGSVVDLMQRLASGKRFYLTNIQARRVKPADVRQWDDDLWMFPYYTNPNVIPDDVKNDGPASGRWPGLKAANEYVPSEKEAARSQRSIDWRTVGKVAAAVAGLILIAGFFFMAGRRHEFKRITNPDREMNRGDPQKSEKEF